MPEPSRDPAIRGKTIRFTWTEGPTKGTTHEHVFHEDGTVEWRDADAAKAAKAGQGLSGPSRRTGRCTPAVKAAEAAWIVSYLAASGYTLTVVLNFQDHQLVGFASSSKDWFPVRGTFEVVK